MRRLTSEEWASVKAPFSFINANGVGWGPKQRLLIEEWLEANVRAGWYFSADDMYVFESSIDALIFRMWATGDPFGIAPPPPFIVAVTDPYLPSVEPVDA